MSFTPVLGTWVLEINKTNKSLHTPKELAFQKQFAHLPVSTPFALDIVTEPEEPGVHLETLCNITFLQ